MDAVALDIVGSDRRIGRGSGHVVVGIAPISLAPSVDSSALASAFQVTGQARRRLWNVLKRRPLAVPEGSSELPWKRRSFTADD